MADVLDPQVKDAATAVNAKSAMEAPTLMGHRVADLIANEAAAHWSAMNQLRQAATAKAVELLLTSDAAEATALNKILTGNDVASQMQALLAALNSGQQGVKAAQTTPPVTP